MKKKKKEDASLNCEEILKKVLVSACLLGKRVRYDGNALSVSDETLKKWMHDGRDIPVCPEVMAGMGVPRPPAEISNGDGEEVLDGNAAVVDQTGQDVTEFFILGAQMALDLCEKHNITVAVLAESSPSCGSATIHDGHFLGRKVAGMGVTTALLRQNGIRVFSQHELKDADTALHD